VIALFFALFPFGVFAASAVLAAIPTVALFQILQRFIVGGLTTGAVKG
jgi:arabinogalactan oligomer / maltooligosaccharide transport system permease protein